ncbi:MAG: four helix bundle protein [Flavobacteriales bacterium]|nr:MAG: four helix bundle protein [Flavobacteriales bacterium]
MTMPKKYIQLKDLEVYQLARELSRLAWKIYESLNWQDKKIMGDQFISSTDSVGANIAEGYGRFHYLDKIKFFYNARGSLLESYTHWLELLYEREKITTEQFEIMKSVLEKLTLKLNNFISSIYKAKQSELKLN